MFETEYNRVIETAKARAILSFQQLVQNSLQGAGRSVVQQLLKVTSNQEQNALTTALIFIQQDSDIFRRCMDSQLRVHLNRAMQTMYVDLRTDMRQVSMDELSLIGNEIVNHQIAIGRLAQRMRETNEVSIARLNAIIGMLHGRTDARERENPFRPYLLARTFYEAITVAPFEAHRVLSDHLADAMILHLPEYYSSIHKVFEASGIGNKLIIQTDWDPFDYHRHHSSSSPISVNTSLAQCDTTPPSDLTNLIDIPDAPGSGEDKLGAAQEYIQVKEKVPSVPYLPSVPYRMGARKNTREHPLAAQLAQLQKKIAQDEGESEKNFQDDKQSFDLLGSLDFTKTSAMDRLTVEAVSILFSFIFKNEQIPVDVRCCLGRLQVPILKAAILTPEVLHYGDHPVRQLLERISSVSSGLDLESEGGRKLVGEIGCIVDRILENFEDDVSIFTTVLAEFERCLADVLRKSDAQVALGIEALEAAGKISILLTSMTATLSNLLLQLNLDKRIADLFISFWPRILVRAAWSDAEKGISQRRASSTFLAYRDILSELLWSIQENPISKDRAMLIRMLPNLIDRTKQALETIMLPEEENKEIINQIVDMYTQILRGAQIESAVPAMDLDEVRQVFSQLEICWPYVPWDADEPPQIREEAIEEVLAQYRITPIMHFPLAAVTASADNREFLERACLLGSKVTIRSDDGSSRQAQLMWIGAYRSFYLFKQEGNGGLVVYTYASLLEALQQGAIASVECTSLFDRAIDSLLSGAPKP